MAKVELRIRGATFSDVVCAPRAIGVPTEAGFNPPASFNKMPGRQTALFSFEGTSLVARFEFRMISIEQSESRVASILENCIEKNFHVPNMKSGPCEEHGCNFKDPYSTTCKLEIVSMSVFKK